MNDQAVIAASDCLKSLSFLPSRIFWCNFNNFLKNLLYQNWIFNPFFISCCCCLWVNERREKLNYNSSIGERERTLYAGYIPNEIRALRESEYYLWIINQINDGPQLYLNLFSSLSLFPTSQCMTNKLPKVEITVKLTLPFHLLLFTLVNHFCKGCITKKFILIWIKPLLWSADKFIAISTEIIAILSLSHSEKKETQIIGFSSLSLSFLYSTRVII